MFDLFSGLDAWVGISLVLALAFVLTFEFINGFHDTANAVATVIYTKAMSPYRAVMLSGVFNFLGVLLGGVGVAYAIVHLLPVELLINVNTGHGLAMVFSLLAAAIAWNLGTWYFGIPASSSHTLIGSILGVGLANALITDVPLAEGINWQKAIDIGLSLLLYRRIFDPRIRYTSHPTDIAVLLILWVQLTVGLITLPYSLQHADGSVMLILADWAQRIVTLRPVDATALAALPWPYLFHIVFGMTIFLLFPFSRLVHVWSGFASIFYLLRPYQVSRARRLNLPTGHNLPPQCDGL